MNLFFARLTIDFLARFINSLIGVLGSLDGVNVSATVANLAVHNGVVRDWGDDGVDAVRATNSQLQNLRVSDNGSFVLRIGAGSLVTHCTAAGRPSVQ